MEPQEIPLKRDRSKTRSRSLLGVFRKPDRATKRVLAPFVNIIRRGKKTTLQREKVDDKYFTIYMKDRPSFFHKGDEEFYDNIELPKILYDSATNVMSITKSSGFRLYLVDHCDGVIYIHPRSVGSNPTRRISWKMQENASIAGHVAIHNEYVMVDDVLCDYRFPDGVPYAGVSAKAVICAPIVTQDNTCYAVLEVYRDMQKEAYNASDLRLVLTTVGWMGLAISLNEQKIRLDLYDRLNSCLIELTKYYFADRVVLGKMITEIANFTREVVDAEKTYFYIIDPDSEELLSDVYCAEGTVVREYRKGLKVKLTPYEGIAGYVARTGELINIKDAYNDPRFEEEVDSRTGSIIRSVLCMPLKRDEGVLGVIQAVNKLQGSCFTPNDERLFRTFAFYCGLALHYGYTHRLQQKQIDRHIVTVGMIKRQLRPCEHELEWAQEHPHFYENPEAIKQFSWYISLNYMDHMPQIFIHMVLSIAGKHSMDLMGLTEFSLTVRNFYRNIPYHNWEHGFNVCHCMYTMLLRNSELFTHREKKALMIATICHDIDHGGVTNNFLVFVDDVFAQLYEDSPWESHHYTTMMMVLSEINIYNDISAEEFKEVSEIMQHAILSTDLAYYFRIRGKLVVALRDGTFDYNNREDRNNMISVMMNVCDLSGQCKPWKVTKRLTAKVLEEFYAQGDMEKRLGRVPLSLMDREKPDRIPYDQLMFFNALVLPCCDLVRQCLPNCGQLYEDAMKIKEIWVEMIDLINQRCWHPDESVVESKKIRKSLTNYHHIVSLA